jgi:N-acyl homoserine lactone hydrolase
MSDRGTLVERLYLFQLGAGSVPMGEQTLEMSMGCYLVQTSDGRNVLIDTGLNTDVALPDVPPLDFGPNVVEQLANLGLTPDDIDVVISSHFDSDHVGYHKVFANAEHVVQRRHYELAQGGLPRAERSREHWDHPALRYRLVDGDTELLPGVSLIESSGHLPGHQSVLVRLPETGPVLLAIDAVALERLFTPDRVASPIDDNEEELRASTRKLRDLAEQEKVTLLVFGHDGEQWQGLKKAPEWYG